MSKDSDKTDDIAADTFSDWNASENDESSDEKKLDFRGVLTKGGVSISVVAVGGATLYAFGIIIAIAVIVGAIIALAAYLRYR